MAWSGRVDGGRPSISAFFELPFFIQPVRELMNSFPRRSTLVPVVELGRSYFLKRDLHAANLPSNAELVV